MTRSSIPWFVFGMCYAPGVLMIAMGIPLYGRRVPPNMFYGVRLESTLADESVWYDINARGGRDGVVFGAFYLLVVTAALVFGRSWSIAFRVLGPMAVLVVGLAIETIVLAVAAGRLLSERQSASAHERIPKVR